MPPPHGSRRAPFPPQSAMHAPAYDPRTQALNETGIDDLSDLYTQQDSGVVRNGMASTSPRQPRGMEYDRSAYSHPPASTSAATYSQHQQHTYDSPQRSRPSRPAPHPPRTSSIAQAQSRQWAYARSQEEASEDYHLRGSEGERQPYATSQVYGQVEAMQSQFRSTDLEHSFAPQHGTPAYAYADANGRTNGKPLINYITNEWRERQPIGRARAYSNTGRYGSDDEDCYEEYVDVYTSRPCRRVVGVLFILMIIMIYAWSHFLGAEVSENARLKTSVRAAQAKESGFFGVNKSPFLAGLKQVTALDREKVPASGIRREGREREGVRRLIFIGDVHGCIDELKALLAAVSFNPETDHIVTTGDMIARGPSSTDVLSLLVQHNASCVRGNHEDRVLLAHRDLTAPSHRKTDTDGVPITKPIKQGARSDLELAAELDTEHTEYLQACPITLDLGRIPGMGRVAVAHGGLVPLLPLTRQDPISVMSMRSIDLRTLTPSAEPPPPNAVDEKGRSTGFQPVPGDKNRDRNGRTYSVLWTNLWNMAQKMSTADERTTVIYGHDENRGLVQGDWYYGLDAGCVLGGRLAALVISGGWRDGTRAAEIKKEVVSVACKRYLSSPKEYMPTLGAS